MRLTCSCFICNLSITKNLQKVIQQYPVTSLSWSGGAITMWKKGYTNGAQEGAQCGTV